MNRPRRSPELRRRVTVRLPPGLIAEAQQFGTITAMIEAGLRYLIDQTNIRLGKCKHPRRNIDGGCIDCGDPSF